MPTVALTQAFVDKASYQDALAEGHTTPASDRVVYWSEQMPGFGLCLTNKGARSFVVQYRANGKSRRSTIKGSLPLPDAIKQAKVLQGQVAAGRDPMADKRKAKAATAHTVKAVSEDYFKRAGKDLRTLEERKAVFRRYIYDRFGTQDIASIKRSDISRMVDDVKETSGPAAAESALMAIRRLMNWFATRSDSFVSPVVRGMMARACQPRQRILSDSELAIVWAVASEGTCAFDHFVRFVLLTAVRRNEASEMVRSELHGPDTWIIPGSRYKNGRDHLVPLSAKAQAVLLHVTRYEGCPLVFTNDGQVPMSGWTKLRKAFAKRCRAANGGVALAHFTIHDLRRTSRTLLSRAGVPTDHSERVLGHTMDSLRGTYDVWGFEPEKRAALSRLAILIERIVNPQDNVVPLRAGA